MTTSTMKAASTSLSSEPAYTHPHSPSSDTRSTPTRRIIAAIRRAGTLLTHERAEALIERNLDTLLRIGARIFGDATIITGDPCSICSDPTTGYAEVHAPGEQCPRAEVGECDICARTVDLDRWGNCPEGRYHRILRRRPKPRPRLIPLREVTNRA